jgi:hypothetical protein
VDNVAAFELARSRKFQTTDFEEARSIISFIHREIIDVKIASLRLEWIQDNAYIYCVNDLGKNCLIIDLQNFNGLEIRMTVIY